MPEALTTTRITIQLFFKVLKYLTAAMAIDLHNFIFHSVSRHQCCLWIVLCDYTSAEWNFLRHFNQIIIIRCTKLSVFILMLKINVSKQNIRVCKQAIENQNNSIEDFKSADNPSTGKTSDKQWQVGWVIFTAVYNIYFVCSKT